MRTSPLLADFIHARGCKPICAKLLTLPRRGVSDSALLTKLRIAVAHMVYWRKSKGGDVGMMTHRDVVQSELSN